MLAPFAFAPKVLCILGASHPCANIAPIVRLGDFAVYLHNCHNRFVSARTLRAGVMKWNTRKLVVVLQIGRCGGLEVLVMIRINYNWQSIR